MVIIRTHLIGCSLIEVRVLGGLVTYKNEEGTPSNETAYVARL